MRIRLGGSEAATNDRPAPGPRPRSRAHRPRAVAPGLLAATAAVAALTLAACGDDDEPVTLVEGVEVGVSSLDNTFRPEEIEVAAGTEVVWTNDGRNVHNVLPTEGDDWGVEVGDFEPGDEYRHRFTEPGTYAYYCSLHGTKTKGMVGTVVVTG